MKDVDNYFETYLIIINTNKTLGELSRENITFLHVKIT